LNLIDLESLLRPGRLADFAGHSDGRFTATEIEAAIVGRLAERFGRETDARRDTAYGVIVGRGEKRLGLVVDRLRGQQDVVIKGLDTAISGGHVGVAGATILGDGRVVLVLDVAALFEGSRARAAGEAPSVEA